ncbi:MAG TPA: hypothetical protein VI876_08470 [Dehalococcoidia bacterium]|nr:hypothetical protein [Dehalococcoidia bacterium]
MSESTTQTSQTAPAPQKTSGLPFKLQDGERILELTRRHWIFLWPTIAVMAVVTVVPVILGFVLIDKAGIDGLGAKIVWLILALYFVYWAIRMFLNWYRYHNDIWVITNQRVIDSTKRHPFSLVLSTADLVNIQDMSVVRNGILRTLLDYGDIVCQTAAEQQEFRLSGIPDPRATQALVDRERDRERLRIR